MTKSKKTLISFIFAIMIIISIIFGVYYIYFYPKLSLTPIDNNITTTKLDVLRKFSIDKFSVSLRNKSIESTITLTDDDLTDLSRIALKEMPNIDRYLSGIQLDILDDCINLHCNLKYKSIPFYSKLTFKVSHSNNSIILHYINGKVGCIPISKNIIFSKLKNTEFLNFEKENGNIVIKLEKVNYLKISNITAKDSKIHLTITGSLNKK